ncbi:MAG: adenylate/guanylate cyclase domain-containing protein [Cyanobacteria bacterium J06638_20]
MNILLFSQIAKFWEQQKAQIIPGLRAIGVTSLVVASLVIGVKQLGGWQPLELRIYDWMVRQRPGALPDPRLLIVGITEADIQALGRITPSDADLAQAIAVLESKNPRLIGLDMHRDVPQEPGREALLQVLKSPRLITITNLGETELDRIPPPPGVPPERVGFNDIPVDQDGIVRRNLLFASTETETYYSFTLRLALAYLAADDISPQPSPDAEDVMQLGDAVFHPLASRSGGYERLDDRGYQILLDYRAPRRVAHTVSLSDVLNDQVPDSLIRDRIILIGTTAPSSKDLFFTPYSPAETDVARRPGVEIHAQMLSQFLSAAMGERPLFTFWSESQEWLWILAWAVTGGSLAWLVRNPVFLGITGAGLLGMLVGFSLTMLNTAHWVIVGSPAIATFLSMGTVVTYRAQQAQQQQKMVMQLLGQNTSPEIADALWQSRDHLLESGKLPGQRLVATMLFTDIKGFSRISEKMPPEELLMWLNEYLAAMTEEIQQHQGIINKFTGDGLLAVFGVPMPRLEEREVDQDAHHAVSCALAMRRRLQELNKGWKEIGLHDVQMRVGIFTGPVVVGSLGGRDRMEYGVIGDSVNIASRLESCIKERQVDSCRILIAQETLEHIQEDFEVESWGFMELRGKNQPIHVYRVIDYLDIPAEAPPPASSSSEVISSSVPTEASEGDRRSEAIADA